MHSWSRLLGYPVSTLQAAIHKHLFTPLSLALFSSSYFSLVHCTCLLSYSFISHYLANRGPKRRKMNWERKEVEEPKGFLLYVAGAWRETLRGGKESQTIDFSLFFSYLLLCVTQGGSCEIKRPRTISHFLSHVPLLLPFLSPVLIVLLTFFPLSLHFPISVSLCSARLLSSSVSTPLPSSHTLPLLPVYFSVWQQRRGAWGSWKEVW